MAGGTADAHSVAIVGMAGHFPGAPDVASLWRLLREGRDATHWLSEAELRAAGERSEAYTKSNYVRAAMLLQDIDRFDAGFFGLTPREAAIMDPQHRHFLECCWEALEDAGCAPQKFAGAVGVFGGCGMQAYWAHNLLTNPDLVDQVGAFLLRHTGNDKDFLTTRASYLFNLSGPSVGVQTACSTSLVAVHLACQSLLSGECDLALAGGASIEIPHGRGYLHAEGEILSSTGRCRAFDDDADGTLFGSGAGVVALARLEDAVREQFTIRAVIRGSAINNDGANKAGYFAPSVEGQARAAAEALAVAEVSPDSVEYIEAHGTGTLIGDPIELTALQEAYKGAKKGRIGIGSIKSNIGHLDTAAGVASLIKTVLALENQAVPPTLHYAKPNSRFDFRNSPFKVVEGVTKWTRGSRPRRAGVNSLGVGGTNAHVIVEEAPAMATASADNGPQLILLSAKTQGSLAALTRKWAQYLADPPGDFNLADAAFTTHVGRADFMHRCAVVARTRDELREGLSAPAGAALKGVAGVAKAKVVWMFPGGGAQYAGTARDFYAAFPVFRTAVDECFDALKGEAGELRRLLFEPASQTGPDDHREPLNSVLGIFILEYALGRLWHSWGVKPDAVLGHSAGEYAAAVFAGVFSVSDALTAIRMRGGIFQALPKGAMLSVKAPADRVAEAIGRNLEIAAVNGSELVVVSGEVDRVDALASKLRGEGIESSRVHIDVAAHSRMLDTHLDAFRKGMARLKFSAPKVRFISTLTGSAVEEAEVCSPDYWVRQLRHTVRFSDALTEAIADSSVALLEVGPGQSLTSLALAHEGRVEPAAVCPSMQHGASRWDDVTFLLRGAGLLWACGAEIDIASVRDRQSGRRISLPTYAFEKQRHWVEPGRQISALAAAPRALLERQSLEDWVQVKGWRSSTPPAAAGASMRASWLIFVDESAVSAAVVRAARARDVSLFVVRSGTRFEADGGGAFRIRPDAPEDYLALIEAIDAEGGVDAIVHLWSVLAPPLQFVDGEPRLPLGFDSVRELAKALELSGWDRPVTLCVATTGAFATGDMKPLHPERAALIGPCRTLRAEASFVDAFLLDLEADLDPSGSAETILAELRTRSNETLIAYRNRVRLVESSVPATAPARQRLRHGGVCLITGGLGDLGLELAKYLAGKLQARLVLASAHGFADRQHWASLAASDDEQTARRARALMEMTEAGAEVAIFQCDLRDEGQVASMVAKARERFGAIHAVVHAAGLVDDAPIAMRDAAGAWRVMGPKVVGGLTLNRLFPDGSLDLFAVYSSTSVAVAPAGQADYVAANAVLESIAAGRRDGLSVAWGPWAEVGIAARFGQWRPPEGRARRHPLLGYRGEDGASVQFHAQLTRHSLWAISEHKIGDHWIAPGALYFEIANGAAREIGIDGPFALSNVNFPAPLAFGGLSKRLMRTTLTPVTSNEWRMEVESRSSVGEEWTTHFEARIGPSDTLGRRQVAVPEGLSPLAAPQAAVGKRNIAFGPRWRCVTAARTAQDVAVVDLALSPEFADDLRSFRAHPALVDLAAAAGLFLLSDVGAGDTIYAPISIARFEQFADLPSKLSACALMRGRIPGVQATFDVDILDEHDALCARFEGVTFRKVESSALAQLAVAPPVLREEATPLEKQVALGIRPDESERLFARVFTRAEHSIVASSVAVTSMIELQAAEQNKEADGAAVKDIGTFASDTEARIARMCAEILGVSRLDPEDEFLSFGGGSLAGVRLFARIRKELGVDLPLSVLFQAPTLRALTRLVERQTGSGGQSAGVWSPLVRIAAGEVGQPPLFCVHGAGGNVIEFKPLADRLPKEIPFYGLQAQGVDGKLPFHTSIEEMARSYVAAIRTVDSKGPYRIAGYSGGGVIAYEMAQMLRREGAAVELLVMFDTLAPEEVRAPVTTREKIGLLPRMTAPALSKLAMGWFIRLIGEPEKEPDQTPLEIVGSRAMVAYLKAQSRYTPAPYSGDLVLFRALHTPWVFARAGDALGWDKLFTGRICVIPVDADHNGVFQAPVIDVIVRELSARLLTLPPRSGGVSEGDAVASAGAAGWSGTQVS